MLVAQFATSKLRFYYEIPYISFGIMNNFEYIWTNTLLLYIKINWYMVCTCFRTLQAITGWVRYLLATEQKKTDFKPETEEIQMFSPVSNYLCTKKQDLEC